MSGTGLFRRSLVASILLGLQLGEATLAETGQSGGEAFEWIAGGVCHAPVVVAADAPEEIRRAAQALADYVEKIAGVRPPLVAGLPDPVAPHAVYVGWQDGLDSIFPGLDAALRQPEEILVFCDGSNLLIAGADLNAAGENTGHATANAVFSFLQERLGVRWLWPGELGEDVPQADAIVLEAFERRHRPPFLTRHLWPRNPESWHRAQRIWLYAEQPQFGEAFGQWWEDYHLAYPDVFALRGDGTRTPEKWGPHPNPHAVKLCLSNPLTAQLWIDEAEKILRAEPARSMLGISPNDGGGFCVCDNCRAWDHPDAPPGALTDRYVRFWNILAEGLRERLPDRRVTLGAMAYSAYSSPPIAETLGPGIAISLVGFFPLTTPESRAGQKQNWQAWAGMAESMFYRPNLWYWGGGVWGLPEVAMQRTIEDFRWLAENNCRGITVDVLRNHWATQGPQYYLMAQLAYDPWQEGNVLLEDYYRRAFGPAAGAMREYWELAEQANTRLMEHPELQLGAGHKHQTAELLAAAIYTPDYFLRAGAILDRAAALAAAGDPIFARRVNYVRCGFDFSRLVMAAVPAMHKLASSRGEDRQALAQAGQIWQELEELAASAPEWALAFNGFKMQCLRNDVYMGGMQPVFGPPTAEFLEGLRADQSRAADAAPPTAGEQ